MSAPPDLAPAASAAQRGVRTRARVRDALRLLPFLGLALFIAPDLVLSGGPAAQGATAPWLLYLFAAWVLLVALTVWLGRMLRRAEATAPPAPDG